MSNYFSESYNENRLESIKDEVFRKYPELEEDSTEFYQRLEEEIESWEYENNNPALTAYERNR